MINKIIDGISIALNDEFGDDYKIYIESVEQGLDEPCFSIVCVNPKNDQFLGKRYFRQNLFCVHYFPCSNEKNAECMDVLARLYDCLEMIGIDDGLIRGINMSGEIDDGVLTFLLNYDMFVIRETEEGPLMEELIVNQNLKG